eukprot:586669-Karenia_brevis.AAC.1
MASPSSWIPPPTRSLAGGVLWSRLARLGFGAKGLAIARARICGAYLPAPSAQRCPAASSSTCRSDGAHGKAVAEVVGSE